MRPKQITEASLDKWSYDEELQDFRRWVKKIDVYDLGIFIQVRGLE